MSDLEGQVKATLEMIRQWMEVLPLADNGEAIEINGDTYEPEEALEGFLEQFYCIEEGSTCLVLQHRGGGPSVDWLIVTLGEELWYTALIGAGWGVSRKAFYEQDDTLWQAAEYILGRLWEVNG